MFKGLAIYTKNLHLNKFKIEFSSSKAFLMVETVKLERHEG